MQIGEGMILMKKNKKYSMYYRLITGFLSVLCFILPFAVCTEGVIGAEPLSKAGQYIVKKGDSLYKIGKNYGVSVEMLKGVNRLTTDIIKPGQILLVMPDFSIILLRKGTACIKSGKDTAFRLIV